VQNFKRDSAGIDKKIATILAGGAGLESPVETVGEIARAFTCAAPGHRFLIGDFSGIESRVLAWLSGQESKLDQWRAFDASGALTDDPYYRLGILCGQPEERARAVGKIVDLAFGYQGGVGAWQNFASEDDATDEATIKSFQKAFQRAHPQTVNFWRAIDRVAVAVVQRPDIVAAFGGFTLTLNEPFLRITLPSGRTLSYPYPRLGTGKFGHPVVIYKDNDKGKWVDVKFGRGAYGGLWTENVVSATARDLLAAAMIRLEAAGYRVVLHVHDEIVVEMPEGAGSLDEFKALLVAMPPWAGGLPVNAKVRESARFSKPDTADAASYDESNGDGNGDNDGDNIDCDEPQPITQDDLEAINVGLAGWGIGPITATVTPPPDDSFAAITTALTADTAIQPAEPPHSNGYASGNGFDTYPHGEHRGGQRLAVYLYRDHLGNNHTQIEKRISTKTRRPQYPQRFWFNGCWSTTKPAGWVRIPYRLPEMLAALAKAPATSICCPEGEKDCETLAALGLIATTNSEGATPLKVKTSKWAPELNRWFHGVRRLFILADNDEVGRRFADEKARALASIVPDIRIVHFPDTPQGEDVSWWLEHGHSKAELLARCEAAPRWNEAELDSVRADQVVMKAVTWLWPKRFAIGKIGIIAGLPDEGKGQILCYIAARATRGSTWPNGEGHCAQGNVVILSAEEDPSDSLTPRLEAAGADRSRIHILKMVHDRDENGAPRERMFSLVTDLQKLRQKILEVGNVKIVEIDPVSAYLGIGKLDSYRDSDVRAVLGPLKELAEEMRVAVIAVMHFNKKVDITNALLRVSNSMAFVGLPRHVYSVVADAENARKLFVRAKNNDAAETDNQTLAFHFSSREVGVDPDTGELIRAPFIEWEPGYVDITATEAMQAAAESKSVGARDKAKQFLLTYLSAGPAPSTEVEQAAKAHLISKRTLERAADELKITIDKDRTKPDGKWFWKLPDPNKTV
jgi:hypothetical protein